MDRSREADAIVDSLGKAMQSGETGLRYVPALLLRVINEDMWQDRIIAKTGERAHFDRFIDFVTAQPLEGLGADLPTLRRLCHDNPEALDALDRVTQGKGGNPTGHNQYTAERGTFDNIQGSSYAPTGTSRAAALRRLRASRPDLHEKVIIGELSPHAAMVEAGYRKQTITVPLDTEAAAAAILRHFTPEQVAELVARLLSLKA